MGTRMKMKNHLASRFKHRMLGEQLEFNSKHLIKHSV